MYKKLGVNIFHNQTNSSKINTFIFTTVKLNDFETIPFFYEELHPIYQGEDQTGGFLFRFLLFQRKVIMGYFFVQAARRAL